MKIAERKMLMPGSFWLSRSARPSATIVPVTLNRPTKKNVLSRMVPMSGSLTIRA